MNPRPEINWQQFARDVKSKIDANHGSYRRAVAAHTGTNAGMFSRACSGHVLSVPSYLHLCKALNLDAYAYYSFVENQAVTEPVSCETQPVDIAQNFEDLHGALHGRPTNLADIRAALKERGVVADAK